MELIVPLSSRESINFNNHSSPKTPQEELNLEIYLNSNLNNFSNYSHQELMAHESFNQEGHKVQHSHVESYCSSTPTSSSFTEPIRQEYSPASYFTSSSGFQDQYQQQQLPPVLVMPPSQIPVAESEQSFTEPFQPQAVPIPPPPPPSQPLYQFQQRPPNFIPDNSNNNMQAPQFTQSRAPVQFTNSEMDIPTNPQFQMPLSNVSAPTSVSTYSPNQEMFPSFPKMSASNTSQPFTPNFSYGGPNGMASPAASGSFSAPPPAQSVILQDPIQSQPSQVPLQLSQQKQVQPQPPLQIQPDPSFPVVFPQMNPDPLYYQQRSQSFQDPATNEQLVRRFDPYLHQELIHKQEKFNSDDIRILKSLLQNGEKVKWRYISSRLSQMTGRRATSAACARKTRELFKLPSEGASGSLATSLPYVVHDAWDRIVEETI